MHHFIHYSVISLTIFSLVQSIASSYIASMAKFIQTHHGGKALLCEGYKCEKNEDVWKIYCRRKSQGCEWTDELGSLGHLDVECGFVQLECGFSSVRCCAKFLKKDSAKHRDENVHYHMILTATTQIEYQKTRQMFEQKTQQEIQDYILQKNSEIGGIQTGVERSERTNCEKGVGDGTNAPADHRSRTKARKACEGSGGVN